MAEAKATAGKAGNGDRPLDRIYSVLRAKGKDGQPILVERAGKKKPPTKYRVVPAIPGESEITDIAALHAFVDRYVGHMNDALSTGTLTGMDGSQSVKVPVGKGGTYPLTGDTDSTGAPKAGTAIGMFLADLKRGRDLRHQGPMNKLLLAQYADLLPDKKKTAKAAATRDVSNEDMG